MSEEEEEEEEEAKKEDDDRKDSNATSPASSPHKGDAVQPALINYKSFSSKLKAYQQQETIASSFSAFNNLPQGWLHRLKKSKSAFSSQHFKREYFIVVPKDKVGGDLVLCRFKKGTQLETETTTNSALLTT